MIIPWLSRVQVLIFFSKIWEYAYACVCRMNTNVPLYQSLRDVVERGDSLSTQPYDDVDCRVARLFLNDFEQCGIHLDDAKVGFSCHYYGLYF